jgi:pSer/pThr/pTyr-binding forkhead associated (FHA) protein
LQDRTRIVLLDVGQERHVCNDSRTIYAKLARRDPAAVPFEALFVAHYAKIRTFCREAREPGIAVVAVHIPTLRLVGRLWLGARPGRATAAIIGRHSHADLLLTTDSGLSLRHLALVVHPLRSWDGHEARFTVLDLRTERAFHDEHGRQLDGVRCEGPALLSCGDYALYVLQTGDATDWPPLAGDAWSMLPRRVYLDERKAEPDRWQRRAMRQERRRPPRDVGTHSFITAIRGPVLSDDGLLREGETAIGAFNVLTDRSARRFSVGPAAASRGILLGRYSRCEASDLFADGSISRTHLLLLEVGGTLYAIDTASTEGSFVDRDDRRRREFRVVALEDDDVVVIGDDRAVVRWHAAAQ